MNLSDITLEPPDVSTLVRGSVTGALVLVLLISLAVVAILCKIVSDNRRMKKKIKSQRERRRLTSVTNCSTDGSIDELRDNNSLVDNDAYVSSTQIAMAHIQNSSSMRELDDERLPVCVRHYSMVDNQAYGSVDRDNVFTSSDSESTYEYI